MAVKDIAKGPGSPYVVPKARVGSVARPRIPVLRVVVTRTIGRGGAASDVGWEGVLPETPLEGDLPEATTPSEGSMVGAAIAPETIQGVGDATREKIAKVEASGAPLELVQAMNKAVAAPVATRVPWGCTATVAPALLFEGPPTARTVPSSHLVLLRPIVP